MIWEVDEERSVEIGIEAGGYASFRDDVRKAV
jgi:hypothetical protein